MVSDREIAHISRFVERFRAKASKARQAQSRLKALDRLERISPAHVDAPFDFEIPAPERAPSPLVTLEDAALGHGGLAVLENVQLALRPGARLGLVGANGAGKSTLVKALAGELAPLAGRRLEGHGLVIGYFAQHQLEQLRPDESPLQHLCRAGHARARTAQLSRSLRFPRRDGRHAPHVFIPEPLSGDASADKKMIYEALAGGRCFVSYDLPGSTRGFVFNARALSKRRSLGDEIRAKGGVTMQAHLPKPAEIRLFEDGKVIRIWKNSYACAYSATEPGVYRVEVWKNYLGLKRGWIFSNPIYVR